MESFGDRLKRRREHQKLTRRDLEYHADVPAGIVSRLESGETKWPSMPHGRRLAYTLGVTLDWLACMDEFMRPPDDSAVRAAAVGRAKSMPTAAGPPCVA